MLPTLPPNALLIDNSILDEFNECPRQFEYRFLHRRKGAFSKAALNFGQALHLALAVNEGGDHYIATCLKSPEQHRLLFLAARDGGTPFEIAQRLITLYFDENPQPPEDHRSCNHALETFRRYNDFYASDPFNVIQTTSGPFVEFAFMFKLFDYPRKDTLEYYPIYYCGKIDLAVTRDNAPWVVDHKTAYQLGELLHYEMQMTAQMPGYCWAYEKQFGVLPQGYIVDCIRTSVPTQKLVDKVAFSGETELLDTWWKTQFYREPFFVDKDKIVEWEHNTIALIEELLWNYFRGYLPMKRKWCVGKYGRCQFYDVCSSPIEQRLLMLQSNLFVDDDWSPLVKH